MRKMWYIDQSVCFVQVVQSFYLMVFPLCFSGETQQQAVSSSTPPPGACEDEEQEEGLTPILRKWFSERSSNSGGAMSIEQQGEQPSPVSILDSPFHDEVSTTPEASLTGQNNTITPI